jgi:hypothetical protein
MIVGSTSGARESPLVSQMAAGNHVVPAAYGRDRVARKLRMRERVKKSGFGAQFAGLGGNMVLRSRAILESCRAIGVGVKSMAT